MRKLASIQRVIAIDAIPDADAIEKATILGWECVVAKKDSIKVGDLVVYIEVDSVVPEKPEFEFLRQRKFRIRTIKLKGQISQGLVLPLSYLPKGKYVEGDDVTTLLGIKKYDPEWEAEQKLIEEKALLSNNRIKRYLAKYSWYHKLFFKKKDHRGFPTFIHKTDEDRIQLFPDICEKYKDDTFIVTEKLDGQSGTFFLLRKPRFSIFGFEFGETFEFGVCSRNLRLNKPDNSSYWKVAIKYDLQNILSQFINTNKFVAIQGEILGTNIQGNKYSVSDFEFYAFNLIIDGENYSTPAIRETLKRFDIKTVPLLDSYVKLKPTIQEMIEYSKGTSKVSNILREGIVVRNYEKGISFKVINPDFLLKYGA